MREAQIEPAAVDVEGLPQVLDRHRRALDVPAGPSLAPRAIPRRLAWLGVLPQGEVARVFLLRTRLDSRAGFQLFRVEAAKLAIILVARHIEVDVAISRVGVPLLD